MIIECLRSIEGERDAALLQIGNLLDFIGSVRLWASGQPTGKSIQESCTKILEKYAEKRNDDPGWPGGMPKSLPNPNEGFAGLPNKDQGFAGQRP
jgi:hypothetical protein